MNSFTEGLGKCLWGGLLGAFGGLEDGEWVVLHLDCCDVGR